MRTTKHWPTCGQYRMPALDADRSERKQASPEVLRRCEVRGMSQAGEH